MMKEYPEWLKAKRKKIHSVGTRIKNSFPTISSGGSGELLTGSPIEKISSQISSYKLLKALGEDVSGLVLPFFLVKDQTRFPSREHRLKVPEEYC